MITKPTYDEYPEYYKRYIDSLPEEGILEYYSNQTNEVETLLKGLTEEKLLFRYETKKWSIKELIAHLLDSEIIMGYRALTYCRNDKTNLPMYDHDEYVNAGNFDTLKPSSLIKHYAVVRESNLLLFESITDQEWIRTGITGDKTFTTRTIPYIVTGHTEHHINILKERYL